jgi:hypothetical protein
MSRKAVFRFAFCLCLLLVAALGVSRSANACPRAVTITYYAWVDPSNPSYHYWCQVPLMSPACAVPNCGLVWQAVGQVVTDCDGNVSSWGGPCQDLDPQPANEVETSHACTCHS